MDTKTYKKELKRLQIELVKMQRYLIKCRLKVLIIVEGRDAAGKDGVIKRITQHLSPRETRVVALSKPSNTDLQDWYFQRYVAELPGSGEMVIMNRSWYNRAGVERVMGFCTANEYQSFMRAVMPFEHLLVESGFIIVKYYLDINKGEQAKRLKRRKTDPLRQWKTSPVDEAAQKQWGAYSTARNDMLVKTTNAFAPWYVVKADSKKKARLNVIRHILATLPCDDQFGEIAKVDQNIVFIFKPEHLKSGAIAP